MSYNTRYRPTTVHDKIFRYSLHFFPGIWSRKSCPVRVAALEFEIDHVLRFDESVHSCQENSRWIPVFSSPPMTPLLQPQTMVD